MSAKSRLRSRRELRRAHCFDRHHELDRIETKASTPRARGRVRSLRRARLRHGGLCRRIREDRLRFRRRELQAARRGDGGCRSPGWAGRSRGRIAKRGHGKRSHGRRLRRGRDIEPRARASLRLRVRSQREGTLEVGAAFGVLTTTGDRRRRYAAHETLGVF